MARCRVVAIRTGTREPPSTDSAAGISTPCNGRPAQEQEIRATAKAPVARSRLGVFAVLPTVRARLRSVWRMEENQDNSQAPNTTDSSGKAMSALTASGHRPVSEAATGNRVPSTHTQGLSEPILADHAEQSLFASVL